MKPSKIHHGAEAPEKKKQRRRGAHLRNRELLRARGRGVGVDEARELDAGPLLRSLGTCGGGGGGAEVEGVADEVGRRRPWPEAAGRARGGDRPREHLEAGGGGGGVVEQVWRFGGGLCREPNWVGVK